MHSNHGTQPTHFNKPLENRQNKRYGFRIGVSMSKLPVTSADKKGVGLYKFRNSKGDEVSYKNEFSTSGTTSFLCLGVQSRKQIRYRYDVIEKNTAFPHNTAYVRDLYFDMTYLTNLRYNTVYDQTDKLEQDGIRDIYSIRFEDNPIQPLGFCIGIQALHQGGKQVGIKVGAEFGSRYGIGASSFAFTNISTYYTKFSCCMILLPDPR